MDIQQVMQVQEKAMDNILFEVEVDRDTSLNQQLNCEMFLQKARRRNHHHRRRHHHHHHNNNNNDNDNDNNNDNNNNNHFRHHCSINLILFVGSLVILELRLRYTDAISAVRSAKDRSARWGGDGNGNCFGKYMICIGHELWTLHQAGLIFLSLPNHLVGWN